MIKSIIYLDEPKMYSLSSQFFEGMTEYMFEQKESAKEELEQQKGPVASGKLLADTLKSSQSTLEKRVFHDYAFTVFERKLLEAGNIVDVRQEPSENIRNKIAESSFIRIKAPVNFVDAAKLAYLLKTFNKLGEALAYTTKFSEISAIDSQLEAMKEGLRDKTKIATINNKQKEIKDASKIAREIGFYQDPTFLEHLIMLTNFGFSNQLEIQQRIDSIIYSSCLKREHLRDTEDLIIRKYSRKTEKELTILGIITQSTKETNRDIPPTPEDPSMKAVVTNMIEHIAMIESGLSGKLSDEVVIDPIAMYADL